MGTTKPSPEAAFQFFYCSKEPDLPFPNVPVRDVTNSQRHGHKLEPNLERMMENWCSCRPKSITAAAKRALALAAAGQNHYLVLTTRDPRPSINHKDRKALAIGLLPFSPIHYNRAMHQNKDRWNGRLPYVSDKNLKICSFEDAYALDLKISKDGHAHVPGSRCTSFKVPADTLDDLLAHFASKPNRHREFLANVRALERKLAKHSPQAYENYRSATPALQCCT